MFIMHVVFKLPLSDGCSGHALRHFAQQFQLIRHMLKRFGASKFGYSKLLCRKGNLARSTGQ